MMFLIFLFTVTFYKLCINYIKLIGVDFEKFDIWTCVPKKFESCWFWNRGFFLPPVSSCTIILYWKGRVCFILFMLIIFTIFFCSMKEFNTITRSFMSDWRHLSFKSTIFQKSIEHSCTTKRCPFVSLAFTVSVQGPVVQRLDSAFHWKRFKCYQN